MSVERGIRFDLIARLCPNSTGAELRSVATEVSSVQFKYPTPF
jgi:26S proteasome regulatory subunit T1